MVAQGREGVVRVEGAHALQPVEGGVHALLAGRLEDPAEHALDALALEGRQDLDPQDHLLQGNSLDLRDRVRPHVMVVPGY